jgi:hypothetical protein
VDVTGNATLLAGPASDGTRGDVEIIARDDSENDGVISVGGTTFVSTSASASTAIPAGDSADSFAGNISVESNNGGSVALHDTTLVASANGQDNSGNGSGSAGSGNAGTIEVHAFNAGSVSITGNLSASADAIGGNLQTGGLFGGGGFGGTIDVSSSDGTIGITGNAFLSVLGNGGDYVGAPTFGVPEGGFAQGGTAVIASNGPGSITIGGGTTIRADGSGGDGQTGGQGNGGVAGIEAIDGTVSLGATNDISAQGTGGKANAGFGGRGGDGFGGFAYINALAIPPGVEQFASAGTITGGSATINASGTGGSGGIGNGDNIAAGDGGDGFGGEQCRGDCFPGGASAAAQVDGASLSLGNVTLFANGTGGAGGTGGNDQAGGAGGNGTGGSVETGLFMHPFFQTDSTDGTASYGAILGFASGTGGNGGAGGSSINGPMPQGNGGDATGGDATLWTNGLVTALNLTFFANANGGTGGTGGQASGGSSTLTSTGDAAFLHIFGNVVLEGAAASGDGTAGATGNAFGGTAEILADGGDVTIDGTTELYANGDSEEGITGGFGQGGSARVTSQNGSALRTTSLLLQANGEGGNAAAGDGGDAQGGFAQVSVDSGSSITTGDLTVDASATGGNGAIGGNAFGGRAQVFSEGFEASLDATGLTNVTANGTGGNGTVLGTGGNGFGGYAAMFAGGGRFFFGGSITLNDALVSADGTGGSGGAGGDGFGGEDGIESNGGADVGTSAGTFTVTGTLTASAVGTGGAGTTTGGAGGGGQVDLSAFDAGVLSLGTTTVLDADGVGGNGPAAGLGEGGSATLLASLSTVTAGDVTLTASGDEAGTALVDIAGSDFTSDSLTMHADGDGGTATLLVESDIIFGDGVTILDSSFETDAFTATANGGTAGDIFVTVNSGSTADLGVAQLSALGAPGTGSITIDLGADTVLSDFAAFGGIGTLGLENTLLTADSLALNTSGDVNVTSVTGASIDVTGLFHIDATGDLSLDDNDEDGVIRADVIDWHANNVVGNFDLLGRLIGVNADVDIDLTDAGVFADDTVDLFAGNDINTGDLNAGLLINLNAGNDITVGNLNSGGDIAAEAGGDITTEDLTADGETDLDAVGNILFGDVDTDTLDFSADGTVTGGNVLARRKATGDAGGAIVLQDITVGPGPEVPGDFSVGIASATSIQVGDVQSFGRVGFATLGDLTTGNIIAGPLFLTLVSGDITVGSITTDPGGRVYMADASMFTENGGVDDFDPTPVLAAPPVPTGGSITINGPVSTGRFQAAAGVDINAGAITAAQSIEASAGNDLFTGDLDAGTTVDLTAGNNVAVNNVDAGTSAEFTADGVAIFLGTVSAPTITVTSADIDIVGQLGVHGVTDLVTLNAVSDGAPILIGGEQSDLTTQAEGLQYWLADDEEIQGDTIIFNAFGEGGIPTPDVLVSDFEIEGSQLPGGGAHHVELNTDGDVLFSGTLAYTSAAATDELLINARNIEVNTSQGGRIAMVDSSLEAPSGILELNADNIWVGDQTLLDNLNEDANFAGRDDMVGTNSGDVVPEGYLIADGMSLSVANSLFVQNSGGPADFAGISVGDGGLTIRTTGEGAAEVVAYGRKFNGDGTFTTGNQFFNLVDFGLGDGSSYTDLSEFNECLINIGCSGGGPEIPESPIGPEQILGPIDLMNNPQETAEGNDDASGSDGFRDELVDTSNLSGDELLDEGVTSGGDNNQWGDICPADPATQRCVEEKDGSGKQER